MLLQPAPGMARLEAGSTGTLSVLGSCIPFARLQILSPGNESIPHTTPS